MHISPAEPNFTSPLRLLIQQLSVSEKECALSLESERETMLRKFQVSFYASSECCFYVLIKICTLSLGGAGAYELVTQVQRSLCLTTIGS